MNNTLDLTQVRLTPAAISDYRRARKTRFLVDENIEPWAVNLMRRNRLDLWEVRGLGLAGCDDRKVFALSWRHRRLLITHDTDYLDDTRFPYNRCGGLMVLPMFGRQTLDFSALVGRATRTVEKGADLWFGTKIVVSQDKLLTVHNWEKSKGSIDVWRYQLA